MLAARRRLSAASTSPLLRRRLSAQTQPTASPAHPPPEVTDSGPGEWAGRAVALSLLGLTGAVAASAVSDLSVFLSCSSQAIEKATQNQHIVNAIGKPIVRGPWYSASIAVNHVKHSVSCTFPVSGPQGNGLLKLKAMRLGVSAFEEAEVVDQASGEERSSVGSGPGGEVLESESVVVFEQGAVHEQVCFEPCCMTVVVEDSDDE